MTLRQNIRTSRESLAALAGIGVVWGTAAAMLPAFQARLGVGDAELGVILLAASGGALVAMALAPRIGAALGSRALFLTTLAMALAVAPLGSADGLWVFAAVLLAIGTTSGLVDILANARVAELEARHGASLMNLNHACYSFVYAGAALAAGAVREGGVPLGLWFAILGGVVAALALRARLAGTDREAEAEPQTVRGHAGRHAWIAGVVVLIGFFVENATELWSAIHVERSLGGNAAEGAFGPAMLGLAMGVGRLLGHVITTRGTEARVIGWAALVSSAGLLVAALAPTPLVAYLGFGLLGLGASVIAPLGIALAGRAAPPGRRTLAVSRAAMVGYLGFFVGPPLMGFLSEIAGLRAAFAFAALMLLVIPGALLPLLRRSTRAPA